MQWNPYGESIDWSILPLSQARSQCRGLGQTIVNTLRVKILDRYILWKFLGSFLFTALVFSLVAVIIDFSQNVEEFIDEKLPASRVIREFYVHFVVFINGLLWPLFALIAVIFFTSRMAYNSEIISILNAGVSFRRLMRPYLIGAGILALAHLLSNHFLIPLSNKARLDFHHAYIHKESDKGKTRDIHLFINPGTKVFVKDYFKRDTFARNFRLETFAGNRLVSLLKAEEARWKGPPGKWQLRNYEIRTFDGDRETLQLGRDGTLDTVINLTPADFVRYEDTKEMITSQRLNRFIEEEKQRGRGNTKVYEIELYRRTADPVTVIIVTLIGMAVAARKVRGGLGFHLAIGMLIGAIFVFMARFSITFAANDMLDPLLGVWLPNIVFGAIALLLIQAAQK